MAHLILIEQFKQGVRGHEMGLSPMGETWTDAQVLGWIFASDQKRGGRSKTEVQDAYDIGEYESRFPFLY